MTKSRDSAHDPPVQSEEESEEEEGSSSDEEGSESESEPEPLPTKIFQATEKPASSSVLKKPNPQPSLTQSADSSSSDDEESDSEADSDSSIKKPDPNIEPIASKPMDNVQKTPNAKKPRFKPNTAELTTPAKSPPAAGTKRPLAAALAADGEAKETKRSKSLHAAGTKRASAAAGAADGEAKEAKRSKSPPAAGTKLPLAAAGAADGESKAAKRSKKKSETGEESLEEKGKKKSERGAETLEEKGVFTDDSKKPFQRLWSEDDEIVILQGMIDYRAKKKADPLADLNAFLEFIEKSIHIDVSTVQLRDKIRRLKKKYENNFSKEKEREQKVSLKPHEQKAYDLSKKIWGKESNGEDNTIVSPKTNETAVKRNRTENAAAPDEREEAVAEDNSLAGEKRVEGLKGLYTDLGGIENWIAKNGISVIKGEKREMMEEKWNNLNVEEFEIYLKKLELKVEQTKLVLEAVKLSGN